MCISYEDLMFSLPEEKRDIDFNGTLTNMQEIDEIWNNVEYLFENIILEELDRINSTSIFKDIMENKEKTVFKPYLLHEPWLSNVVGRTQIMCGEIQKGVTTLNNCIKNFDKAVRYEEEEHPDERWTSLLRKEIDVLKQLLQIGSSETPNKEVTMKNLLQEVEKEVKLHYKLK